MLVSQFLFRSANPYGELIFSVISIFEVGLKLVFRAMSSLPNLASKPITG